MSSQIASAPTYEVPDGLQGNEIFSAMIASVIAFPAGLLLPNGSNAERIGHCALNLVTTKFAATFEALRKMCKTE